MQRLTTEAKDHTPDFKHGEMPSNAIEMFSDSLTRKNRQDCVEKSPKRCTEAKKTQDLHMRLDTEEQAARQASKHTLAMRMMRRDDAAPGSSAMFVL
jgi:hypothetical protein